MNEYVQHELGDDEQDDKKIRCAEEGAEKAVKASASKSAFRSIKTSQIESLKVFFHGLVTLLTPIAVSSC